MAAKNTGSSEQNKAVQDNRRFQVRKVFKERQKKVLRVLKYHEFPFYLRFLPLKRHLFAQENINWGEKRNKWFETSLNTL
jgi:hypothetical protein